MKKEFFRTTDYDKGLISVSFNYGNEANFSSETKKIMDLCDGYPFAIKIEEQTREGRIEAIFMLSKEKTIDMINQLQHALGVLESAKYD